MQKSRSHELVLAVCGMSDFAPVSVSRNRRLRPATDAVALGAAGEPWHDSAAALNSIVLRVYSSYSEAVTGLFGFFLRLASGLLIGMQCRDRNQLKEFGMFGVPMQPAVGG